MEQVGPDHGAPAAAARLLQSHPPGRPLSQLPVDLREYYRQCTEGTETKGVHCTIIYRVRSVPGGPGRPVVDEHVIVVGAVEGSGSAVGQPGGLVPEELPRLKQNLDMYSTVQY